jgi:hypothetical protein
MKRVFIAFLLLSSDLACFTQIPDAELLLQQTNISVKNGKLIKTISYEIQINNRNGETLSQVSIPYSKLVEVSKIEACVKDMKGVIIKKLQKSDMTSRSSISDYSLYEDDFVREFTLKHNIYPYRICYSYEVQEDEFVYIDYWIPVINRKTPTLRAVLNIEVPKGYKIYSRSQFIDSSKVDSSSLLVKYTWITSYTKLIEPETSSPGISSLMPYVRIVPDNFNYEKPGSLRSWLNYGEWENDLLKNLSDLPQSEKSNILKQVAGVNNTKDKTKILYHYLQDQTRYINITIETGGLKPFPASYVSENKYGDCKALTNYFKAVLEVAGIKSYYTDVKAGEHIMEIDRSFPSQQFNHVFLCVPVQNDTLWIDCTSKMAFGYYGTFTQGRDVFIVKQGESHLSRTPGLSYNEVKESRKVLFHQNIQNQTIADFVNIYRGDRYEYYFSLSNSFNDADRLQYLRNNVIRNGFELIDFKLSVPSRDSAKIELSYSARSSKIYKEYGKDLIIEILPFQIARFEEPKKRKLPVQIDYPVFKTDSLQYEIPNEYKPPVKLPDESVNTEFGRYNIESFVNGNKVTVVKSFLLFSGKYPLEKYSGFYQFLAKVIDIESNNIIVTQKKY